MMPRPPRPSTQLLREEDDLKRRQLRRERLLRRALAALAAAAAVLLQREAASPAATTPAAATTSPPPLSASASSSPASLSSSASAARHHLGSSSLPPSFGEGAEGYFPRGCVWRSVRGKEEGAGEEASRSRSGSSSDGSGSVSSSSSSSSSSRLLPLLEFYLEETKSWTLEMPQACTIAGDPKVRGGGGKKKKKKRTRKPTEATEASENAAASPDLDLFPFPLSSTSQSCDALACTYRGGLWLSGRGRWHSIIEGGGSGAGRRGGGIPAAGKISRNLRLAPLRVAGSAGAFASAVASSPSSEEEQEQGAPSSLRLVAGRTLVLDFGFYRHPSAIGHWAEAAGQLASHVFAAEARGSSERDDDSDDAANDDESGDNNQKLRRHHRFDRVVLLHVSRRHFGEWARAALAAALRVEPGGFLPPVYFQQGVEALADLRPPHAPPPPSTATAEASSSSPSPSSSLSRSHSHYSPPPTIEQREAPARARLEGIRVGDWLALEEAVIVRDASTGGPRFAAPAAAARAWRRRFFELHGMPVPEEREEEQEQQKQQQQKTQQPPTVLYLRKREDRRVLNEAALLEALRSRLGARVVATDFLCSSSISSSPPAPVPVREQLLLLSQADVLLSAHTSALAGALFLRQRRRTWRPDVEEQERQEGVAAAAAAGASAAVVELIQSNWGGWGSLDESFRALTSSFDDDDGGDGGRSRALRHGSWRATRRRHGAYPNRRDGARFGSWGGGGGDGEEEEEESGRRTTKNRKNLCASEGCVEAHTRVDLVVDVEGVTELVGRALRGEEVEWGVE